MSTFLWNVLATVYLAALISLGVSTLREGHTLLFWFAIFLPLLWIVRAVMAQTPRAAGAA